MPLSRTTRDSCANPAVHADEHERNTRVCGPPASAQVAHARASPDKNRGIGRGAACTRMRASRTACTSQPRMRQVRSPFVPTFRATRAIRPVVQTRLPCHCGVGKRGVAGVHGLAAAWPIGRGEQCGRGTHLSNAGSDRCTCSATSVSAVCVSWRDRLTSAASVPCSAIHNASHRHILRGRDV